MKILLSAFACAPNIGSEPGVGWRWALELSKQHDVFVLTDISRKTLIEKELIISDGLHIIYYRPFLLRKLPINSHTAQIIYSLWQYSLLPFARTLHNQHQFDIVIHLTYGVFRHPSFLGFLGIPFVFGPLGGGEDAPWRLKKSISGKEKLKEAVRTSLNKISLLNPFLWLAYANSKLILVKTEDTRKALPWPFRHRAIVFPEIGIDAQDQIFPTQRAVTNPMKVLFAARMLGWKGGHFVIRSVAIALQKGANIELTIVGTGPLNENLYLLAKSLNIEAQIRWINRLPQQELFKLYKNMDCLLFPSLHDSSGNVVLESLSFGLPVICLDIGGPCTLVNDACAKVIPTIDCSEQQIVTNIGNTLFDLSNNEPKRLAMSKAALERSREMSWEKRINDALEIISTHC